MNGYDETFVLKALESAQQIGIAAAAVEHGIKLSTLSANARKRGIKTPRLRRGGSATGKDYDENLLLLCWLMQAAGVNEACSLKVIAQVCGVSRQRIEQIEKKALRKIRWELRKNGFMKEARP